MVLNFSDKFSYRSSAREWYNDREAKELYIGVVYGKSKYTDEMIYEALAKDNSQYTERTVKLESLYNKASFILAKKSHTIQNNFDKFIITLDKEDREVTLEIKQVKDLFKVVNSRARIKNNTVEIQQAIGFYFEELQSPQKLKEELLKNVQTQLLDRQEWVKRCRIDIKNYTNDINILKTTLGFDKELGSILK